MPENNILYVNFEDERLYPIKGDELSLLFDVYLELFPVDSNKKVYLFVDEIQNVPNWAKWARRISDQNKNLKLIITGSSSKLLSREIAAELRGRNSSFTLFPLSFAEYLRAKTIPCKMGAELLYSNKRLPIKRAFNQYFKTGGFPATLDKSSAEELLKEYYHVMFYRDLIERYKIKNIRLFEDYLTLLLDQVGMYFSISSTAKKLTEFGHSFSKNTLSNFSRYAQEIFLTFESQKYSYKIREQLRSPKKLYAIDHGLLQAVRFSFSEDYGRILENIVYLALKRKGNKVYYFKQDKECDFVVVADQQVSEIIQVCKTAANSKTKKREISGLMEAMETYKLKEGLILTEDEHSTIKTADRIIKILPVWYWLILSAPARP